jgi:L-ascorbate metabolism protein UlaG (beta-lactamase superfamily)
MKLITWLVGLILVGVIGFYALNNYNSMEKQGDTSLASTTVEVIPISHASLILQWGDTVVYNDPVGAELFAGRPEPDLILITDIHGDHLSTSTLQAVVGSSTTLIAPHAVADMLPESLKTNLVILNNGEVSKQGALTVQAIPAYNLRQEDRERHTKGRGNGYVIEGGGSRVYIAGDTEDIPEMRALQDIDIAFLPMNLPFTMSVEQAAAAALAFKPAKVYPYHYRGQAGLSDVNQFKTLVNQGNPAIEVVLAEWYPAQ